MKDPFEIDLSEKDEQDLEELRGFLMGQHQGAREGRKARGGRGTDTTDDEVMRQTLDRVNEIDNELFRRDQQQEVTVGEFTPTRGAQDKAEGRFSSSLNRGRGRSQNAAIADKSKRAPLTTDFERWKSNKGELDFPGVDTPTDSPDVRPKDLKQEQRPDTTDPKQSAAARATVPDAPSTERNTAAPLPFTTALSERGASLSFEEAFEGVATGSAKTRLQDPASATTPAFGGGISGSELPQMAGGEEADIAFVRAEEERSGGVGESVELFGGDSSDGRGGDSSVPTRPYESRNDGPPSELGPYELTQDRQNDGFRTVAFENKESNRSVVFQTYNSDLDGPEATVDVSYGDNTETIAEGDADSVYQQFVGELEERRDRNKEREPSDGSGLQSRADERLDAAQRLFGGGR